MPKRRYFRGITTEKAGNGWPLGFTTGYSMVDNKNWAISTINLKSDEVPDPCNDAASFARFMAGMLNCYFNGVETKDLSIDELTRLGTSEEELDIPSPENPVIPFPGLDE